MEGVDFWRELCSFIPPIKYSPGSPFIGIYFRPPHYAAILGEDSSLKWYLTRGGFHVDSGSVPERNTALHCACQWGISVQAAKRSIRVLVVEYGANVRLRNKDGKTAADLLAGHKGFKSLREYLYTCVAEARAAQAEKALQADI